MRHWVSIYYFELSDEALGAKLVCWFYSCICPSLSRVNRGK
ncbi:hypothetical protein F383_07794 [Gossypium arboreum]|uniref:Uncharacterized protein n=1 Tax=Gossypium arboreum TaxID=29729 RepID=A0A0B0NE44_GOSAR|nr:hypothetical protein F383_07794 [Gossypium arboreum]